MKVRVLGCSGGIGVGTGTTSLLLDNDILVDAGTGVAGLSLDEMADIRHVFLTHSHLDHIAALPLLVDSIFDRIVRPIEIHALPETLRALQQHIFNGTVWPDFARLPSADQPVIRYVEMAVGSHVLLSGRELQNVPVNHAVPAVGYIVRSAGHTFAFSGDTTTNDTFWGALNAEPSLDLLIVETAYPERQRALSEMARHYCPSSVAADLAKLHHRPEVWLTHAKPGDEQEIFDECRTAVPDRDLRPLSGGQLFDL